MEGVQGHVLNWTVTSEMGRGSVRYCTCVWYACQAPMLLAEFQGRAGWIPMARPVSICTYPHSRGHREDTSLVNLYWNVFLPRGQVQP